MCCVCKFDASSVKAWCGASDTSSENIREVSKLQRTFLDTAARAVLSSLLLPPFVGSFPLEQRLKKKKSERGPPPPSSSSSSSHSTREACCNPYKTSGSHRHRSLRLLGRSASCLCLYFAKTSCCAAVGTCVVET